MDGAYAFRGQQQSTVAAGLEARHRVGSFSSSGSLPLSEDMRAPPPPPLDTASIYSCSSAATPARSLELHIPGTPVTPKEKKLTSKRLI